jgi:phosphatidate cytidylyltransferase
LLVAAAVFTVVYAPRLWLSSAITLVTALALIEYERLGSMKAGDAVSRSVGVVAGGALPMAAHFHGASAMAPALVCSVFIFFLHGILGRLEIKDAAVGVTRRAAGVLYIALPLSYLVLLSEVQEGRRWIIFLLAVTWANDTLAFMTGRTLGRHRLSPEISPGKTVEGALGGIAGGVVAAFVFGSYAETGVPVAALLVLSVAIGIIGIAGDLSESLLKRGAGVKDSGAILPGHGGVLDRIDSLIFPIPVVYYFVVWQMRTQAL